MTTTLCPGQNTMFWTPNDVYEVDCANCGAGVEFFKDDARRKCRNCGAMVANPKLNLGCAQWCEHARECLGYDPREKLEQAEAASGQEALLDRLENAMRDRFGKDEKRIDHALAVLGHAREILKEEGGDPRVVYAAALLHDIGIQEAERKHGSAAGRYQEIEGPPIAREIMEDLGMPADVIDRVCDIVGSHHSARGPDTREFRILWDADRIVNIPDEYADFDKEQLARLIGKIMKTDTGRSRAESLYL
ncbi:MAG: HD domain-containing protein [Desulfatibacillaceae bacterium]